MQQSNEYSCGRLADDDTKEQHAVVSCITGQKWHWVKIPKTATIAYRSVFFPEVPLNTLQSHLPFSHLSFLDGDTPNDGFTVVRHPLSRFKSAVGHMLRNNNHLNLSFANTQALVDFFEPDLEYYTGQHRWYAPKWIQEHYKLPRINCKGCGLYYPGFIHAMLAPQVYWGYHPKLRAFRFEALDKFDDFIREELGYDPHIRARTNVAKLEDTAHLNFNDKRVVALVRKLYATDFEAFGYE